MDTYDDRILRRDEHGELRWVRSKKKAHPRGRCLQGPMTENDPLQTQREVPGGADLDLITELRTAGFDDATEIGRGGFGVVYRCREAALDRTVAVKVLTADLDDENKERFFREQQAMGRLTGHPNIVNVLQVGATTTGRPYLVMQYHPRDSLDAWIRLHGPLSTEQVLRLGVRLAGAIESAYRFGIIHRDVKPANILLSDYGEPALTDFGIAHVTGGFETATGTVTGSPAFTAPEVLGGDPPGPASDVYGLGATLFCALTGHAAFERRKGEQVVAQFLRITTQPVPDLRETGIDEDVCALIESAMSRSPDDRPTAAALGEKIRGLQLDHGFGVDEMALHAGTEDDHLQGRFSVPLGLPSTEPPAGDHRTPRHASPDVPAGNLALELTSFVGRRAELTETQHLLELSRLVTLTGMGGVGKTRLALRVAADLRDNFQEGVWLVELDEINDDSLLVQLVSSTLGVREQPARPLREVLTDFVASRSLLLVLDNCEHLVSAVAELAESLLRRSPRLRILTTSREALSIGGEATLRVAPLAVPVPGRQVAGPGGNDAVALFAERARSAQPGFQLTAQNKSAVAQICSRLDGLPLAIELAAARIRVMSPEQILERLTNRFTLLTRGSRAAPSRQQTLRWSIDWSYELCSEVEQHLWERLSVFAGGFELDAVEGICDGDLQPDELLDALSSLVDKSILLREEADTVVRFRLLETVREYGRQKLDQSENYTELRRKHRGWYQQLSLAAEAGWISDRQLDWISRLEREQPNLREALSSTENEPALEPPDDAALRATTALFPFWLSRGLLSEGRYWLDRMLARDSRQGTIARITALCADSVLAELQGDLATGRSLIERARVTAGPRPEPAIHAEIAHAEGISALFGGDFDTAGSRLEVALELFESIGALRPKVEGLLQLGWAHAFRGDTERALVSHEKALAITESHGESVYRSYALWGTGVAHWQQGNEETAVRNLRQCLRLARLRDDPLMAAPSMEALAWIVRESDSSRASVMMGAAEALGRTVGSSTVLFPNLLVHHEACERHTRAALGRHAFETARDKGAKLGFHASIAYALGETDVDPTTKMTRRERQVAELVATGRTDKEIGELLTISPHTVHGHVKHIIAKLGLTSRTQIASAMSPVKEMRTSARPLSHDA